MSLLPFLLGSQGTNKQIMLIIAIMKESINLLSHAAVHLGNFQELLYFGVSDFFQGLEVAHKSLAAGRAYAGDVVQYGFHLVLATQRPVILDSEAMGFVLDTGNQLKAL